MVSLKKKETIKGRGIIEKGNSVREGQKEKNARRIYIYEIVNDLIKTQLHVQCTNILNRNLIKEDMKMKVEK